jgi:hypothetical protein
MAKPASNTNTTGLKPVQAADLGVSQVINGVFLGELMFLCVEAD